MRDGCIIPCRAKAKPCRSGGEMAIVGSCLCGSVRYEITGSLKVVGHCHCPMCRKSNGAAFATWGILDPEQFRWTSGVEFVQGYESSPGRERCFWTRKVLLQEVWLRTCEY